MIPIGRPEFGKEELQLVSECVKGGWVSSRGQFVSRFENDFADYCGTKYAVAVSSGTAALHLALLAAGVKAGDEVIIPSLGFVAASNAVKYCGATPVFAEIDKDTWCIDASMIEEKMTKNTKVIIAVHLFGNPCEMGSIMDAADKKDIVVIEDSAQAHGAEYAGKKCGSLGDISCFSFFGDKIISTGEGGAITTNNKTLYEKVNFLLGQGTSGDKNYKYEEIGYSYRLTNLQAALGVGQLKEIERFIEIRNKIAKAYGDKLAVSNKIRLQTETPSSKRVFWSYGILVDSGVRNGLIEELRLKGIDSRPFYHPLHKLPMYPSGYNLPVSENVSAQGLRIPMFTGLANREIKFISDSVVNYLNKQA